MFRRSASPPRTRTTSVLIALVLCGHVLGQPTSRLLALVRSDSLDQVERVRLWCELLGPRTVDREVIIQDPQVRSALADTAQDATLSWLLAAAVQRVHGRLDSALVLLGRAESSLRSDSDERIRAAVFLDQASILSITGDQATATRRFYTVLPTLQRRGPVLDLAATYNGLAFIFRFQEQFDEALKYYDLAMDVADSIGDPYTRSSALRGKAGILMEQGHVDEAEVMYREAMSLVEHPKVEAVLRTELANIMVLRGQFARALPEFLTALELFEAANNLTWSSYLCSRIADTRSQMGDPRGARSYAEKGLHIATRNGLRKEQLDNLLMLPKICAAMGDWKEALTYSKAFAVADDSLRNDVISTELAQLEVRLHEQRDSLVRAEREEKDRLIHEAGVARASDERKLMLLLSCGVLVLIGGLWLRLRRVRRIRLELARDNAAIDQAKQRAERSERVKDQFLANMSHEIRTPMNVIMGMTASLKRTEHLPEQERYLNAIAQSSDNLLVILNDILDLGRLQDGDIVLDAVPFDVRKVVDDVLEVMHFKAEEKKLALKGEVDPEVPAVVVGDPARLNQVLLNLVGNGIKFTEVGGVSVTVSLGTLENGVAHLRFTVVDTGIGIAPERQELIFEEFTQAYSDTTRKYGGTGLGLTITKRLVEMQQGTVTLQSARDQGSSFTLDIPYPVAPEGSMIKERSPVGGTAALEGLHILLAEDNAFNVMVARDELEDMIPGVRVEVATNGREALEMVEGSAFDLVLMDIQMPEMNGYEATAAIRKLGGAKARIPIIAMTANVLESEVERSMKAGMNGFVPKPFRRADLMERITQALAGR